MNIPKRVSINGLLSLLTVIVASSEITARGQQIPAAPPTQWSVTIRCYGTTSQPGRDDLQIHIHTNGKLPGSMEARRPVYDEMGKISLKSPEDSRKLSDEARAAIYSSARSVILHQQIGEEPDPIVDDGDSVEITIGSFDRKISAVFDHSSAAKSAEFKALIKVLQATLPKDFLPVLPGA
jgi:hypothetical protein